MATNVENLKAIRQSYLDTLAAEAVLQFSTAADGGGQPTYSIDGESYSWTEWRKAILDNVEQLNKLIQQLEPYCVRTRVRP